LHADGYEKTGFPLNQDRHARFALPGNNGVSLPMPSPASRLNSGGTLGYVEAIGYFRNPGLLSGRPFMPLFMASYQIIDEIPAFPVNPHID
jgi:hypothetical protein